MDTVCGYLRVQRVDELCPECWRPSLIHSALLFLRPEGVSEHDRGIRCAHCGPVSQ